MAIARRSTLLAAAALLAASSAFGQSYTIVDLGPLPGGTHSRAYKLAPDGTVVGEAGINALGASRPGQWSNGAVIDLGVPAPPSWPYYDQGWAAAVDHSGIIAGTVFYNPAGSYRAFGWSAGQTEFLPILSGRSESQANDVSGGFIVGFAHNIVSGAATNHGACLWYPLRAGWGLLALPDLGGGSGIAAAIVGGHIAGWARTASGQPHACVWSGPISPPPLPPHPAQDLGTLGGPRSWAWGVNQSRVAVGNSDTPGGAVHAFVHDASSMIDLGVLSPYANSTAEDINSGGEIVGWSYSASNPYTGNDARAMLWRSGVVVDLNALLPAGAGWTLWRARGINDAGQIAGSGLHNGLVRGFLLKPCYANCDGSAAVPMLNVQDFSCFLNRFASADPYANCDSSTTLPVLNIQDFSCFLNAFAAGCP